MGKSELAESKLRFYLSMGSKSNDFAKVFIGIWERRNLVLAEFELRFYLSMGSKSNDFAWVFIKF